MLVLDRIRVTCRGSGLGSGGLGECDRMFGRCVKGLTAESGSGISSEGLSFKSGELDGKVNSGGCGDEDAGDS